MQNSDQNKENAPMPENPKPTDEVQMNIETVTPDTEKVVVPTPAHESENRDEQQEKADDAQNTEGEHQPSDEPAKSATADENVVVQEAEKESDEQVSDKENDSDDERDQVETVSP